MVGGSDEGNHKTFFKLDLSQQLSLTCHVGTGIEVYHAESGDLVHTFKTAGPSPIMSWAPTRYVLAYTDLGVLRTVGLDSMK